MMMVVVIALPPMAACTKGARDGAGTGGGRASAVFRAAVVRPASLDPALARSVDELLVADQLFDGLAAQDPTTLDPVPALAAEWTSTPDQQHWDFTLRPNARFSDGSPITSVDVKASLERIAKKGSGSSVGDLLESVSGYGAVAVDGSATELTGVVAPSPEVVHIDLDAPLSVLPSILANPAFGIVPKAVADSGSFPDPPVGSGPFRITMADKDRISAGLRPGVSGRAKRIDFVLFDNKAKAFDAFIANRVDWSEVPADRVDEAGKRFGTKYFRPYLAELFYAFNLRNPKFADPRFREAVVRAIDRPAIAAGVYDGNVRPIDGVIVEGLPGHQEDACGGRCALDSARSKELLAEIVAGGGSVPELQIDVDDDKTQMDVAEAIRADLAEVGITATLRPKPLPEYEQFAVSGEQELFRLGWILPYASPDGVLSPLFQTGFPNNLIGFSVAAVDDHLRAARAEPDKAKRIEQYQAAERAIMSELPIIPIAQFEVHSVASPRVRGLVITATGSFDGRNVWLAPRS